MDNLFIYDLFNAAVSKKVI